MRRVFEGREKEKRRLKEREEKDERTITIVKTPPRTKCQLV